MIGLRNSNYVWVKVKKHESYSYVQRNSRRHITKQTKYAAIATSQLRRRQCLWAHSGSLLFVLFSFDTVLMIICIAIIVD